MSTAFEDEPTEEDLEEIEDEDGECKTCGGTGEVPAMGYVYPGEPHMADIDTQPCPDCQSKDEDDYEPEDE